MRTLTGLLCSLLLATSAFASGWKSPLNQDHPMVGKIYDLHDLSEISSAELFSVLRKAPAVLVGEKHDNPDHHQIESAILEEVISPSPKHVVIFEMLDDSQQSGIDSLAGDDAELLVKEKLVWNEKGWPWADYGPLIRQSLQSGAVIESGNLAKTQIREIYRKGKDAVMTDDRLKTALLVTDAVREQLLDEIHIEHCEMMPKSNLNPMVDIQLSRDAVMAEAIERNSDSKIVLIAGGYHVRKTIGVPMHLRLQESDLTPIVVMLLEVDATSDDVLKSLNEIRTDADYVWFTPRFTNKDYCEDLMKPKSQK